MKYLQKMIAALVLLMTILTACQPVSVVQQPTSTLAESTHEISPVMETKQTNTLIVPTNTPTALPPVQVYMETALPETIPATPMPSSSNPDLKALIIDHRAVVLFDSIPPEFLEKARNTRVLFSDRSVGANISEGLDCLALGIPNNSVDWASVPANCRRGYTDKNGPTWTWKTFNQTDWEIGQVPADILYDPDPVIYDRSNWVFDLRMGEWEQLIDDFANQLVIPNNNDFEVFSFQFNYFSVAQGSDITDPTSGFFRDQLHDGYYPNRERWDISDLEELEEAYPEKVFFYWTTSLARSVGSPESMEFNQMMRDYVKNNGKILFDFADIISHNPDTGEPCFDNRDGVEYCSQNGECENHPDDGVQIPAICQDYTTELDGGHLGSVTSGKIQAAKAFWVLMAVMNGWDGLEQLP